MSATNQNVGWDERLSFSDVVDQDGTLSSNVFRNCGQSPCSSNFGVLFAGSLVANCPIRCFGSDFG